MNKQQTIQIMQEDLNSSPELLNVCFAILNYVCSQPRQNLRHITFGALSRAAKLENIQDVIPASRYLIGARAPLLNLKFEFTEDNIIEEISLEEVNKAQAEGVFYQPDRAELVKDFESKLFIFFTINTLAKRIK